MDYGDEIQEIVLKHAADRINRDDKILPNSRIKIKLWKPHTPNSFYDTRALCELFNEGVVGIVGNLKTGNTIPHIRNLAARYDIPYLETFWGNPSTKDEHYMINFYPESSTLLKAVTSLIHSYSWTKYVVFYKDLKEFFQLQAFLNVQNKPSIIRHLPENDNYREILIQISRELKIKHILLFTDDTETTESFLTQAQEVGMINSNFHFILTTLDLQVLDSRKFQYGSANITALRLIDPMNNETQELNMELIPLLPKLTKTNPSNFRVLHTSLILLYDAIKVFARTLHALDATQRIHVKNLNCGVNDTWGYGVTILNYIKMVPSTGYSGKIDFNNSPTRDQFSLDVISLTKNGLEKIGIWDPLRFPNKFKWYRHLNLEQAKLSENIKKQTIFNRTLIVTTVLREPFCMFKDGDFMGNDRFDGYVVDLLRKLSQKLKFKYIIRPYPKRKFNETLYPWDEVTRQIMQGNGDLAIGDLTITGKRQRILDFVPYIHYGLTGIIKQSNSKSHWFSFLFPFEKNLWIAIGISYLIVCFIFYIIERFLPGIRNPKIKSVKDTSTQFGVMDALWTMISPLLRQRSNIAPSTVSSRILCITWWTFTLILSIFYTANLTARFTLLEHNIEFKDKLSLDFEYGCLNGGTTMQYLQDSESELLKRIWGKIKKDANFTLFLTMEEGIERVKNSNGNFVFLVESPLADFLIKDNCGLTQIKNQLFSLAYGIAIKKDSGWWEVINEAVLQFQDSGCLLELKEKWFNPENKLNSCATETDNNMVIQFESLLGLFCVLIVGLAIGIIFTCMEFIWAGRSKKAGYLRKELQFALSCKKSKKILGEKSQSTPSVTISEENGTPFLDLGINAYGFPRYAAANTNGGTQTNGDVTSFA